MPGSVSQAVVLFAVYSFCGWLIEAVYRSSTQQRFVNPGFLRGPFVPLYGVGAGFVVLLGLPLGAVPLALHFVVYGVALTALEYTTGAILENAFGVRLWDYSEDRFNLHGRVCLVFSLAWAGLALVFARLVHPTALRAVSSVQPALAHSLAIAFAGYLAVDTTASVAALRGVRALLARLQADLQKGTALELEKALLELRRLREAFPHLDKQLVAMLRKSLDRAVQARLLDVQERCRSLIARLEHRKPKEPELDEIVGDILVHPRFLRLQEFRHHSSSIYEHARSVSLLSYRICKRLGFDYRSAARGGLLHDFFLYDWRHHDVPDLAKEKFHGFEHPKIALGNAEASFELNDIERDCILRHMWPLTLRPPRYKESFVVSLADKLAATHEYMTRLRPTEKPEAGESAAAGAGKKPGGSSRGRTPLSDERRRGAATAGSASRSR
jgi:uncharacterized membrane protein